MTNSEHTRWEIRDFLRKHRVDSDGTVRIRRGHGLGPIPLIEKWTAEDVLWGLMEKHSNYRWINIPEFRIYDGGRSIDLLSICAGEMSGSGIRIGYEIKVSRSDFASEIKTPEKYLEAMRFCDQFFYVAPPGLVDPHKLPPKAGLIEISQDMRGRWFGRWRAKTVVRAVTNEPLSTREFTKALAACAGNAVSYRGVSAIGEFDARPFDPAPIFGADCAALLREEIDGVAARAAA